MMASLKELQIIKLSTLIKNIDIKLSAVTELKLKYQILCLALKNNDIVLRYTSESGDVSIKIITWFSEKKKIIQDVCFNATGVWLLILCYDNTLHVIPILDILDKSIAYDGLFPSNEISSFSIPFTSPHQCYQQSCSSINNVLETPTFNQNGTLTSDFDRLAKRYNDPNTPSSFYSTTKINEFLTTNNMYNTFYCDPGANETQKLNGDEDEESQIGSRISMSKESTPLEQPPLGFETSCRSSMIDSITASSSIMQNSCPYPTCITWWETLSNENRAILGYSDGSLCVVGLTEKCPLIGYTYIERGGVEKMLICRDNNMDTITLMINTTPHHEQWKLLLEQKSVINYTFPGDFLSQNVKDKNSSTQSQSSKADTEDWQFVMTIPNAQQSAEKSDKDYDKDNLRLDFDVNNDDPSTSASVRRSSIPMPISLSTPPATSEENVMSKYFPAARAKWLTLRDIGARKVERLKMKLAESRMKSKDPEKNKERLAVMDSPGIVPEILTMPSGPYFSVQVCLDKHLLSALHTYSDTLSVHSMDISLIPLYLYKLPSKCRDPVLTQNIMYLIQTLVPEKSEDVTATNTMNSSFSAQPTQTPLAGVKDENILSMGNSTDGTNSDVEIEDGNTNTQSQDYDESTVDAVAVLSCTLSSTKIGDECDFNERSLLGLYKFPEEKILDIHRMIVMENEEYDVSPSDVDLADEKPKLSPFQDALFSKHTTFTKFFNLHNYFPDVNTLPAPSAKPVSSSSEFDQNDNQVLQSEFPKIHFDKSIIVTDQNVYAVELSNQPHILFLNLANQAQWSACEDFCKAFNLSLPQCIEFAGDIFLKKKKVTQAMVTYRMAKIPLIKTALKLAMFNEVNALMYLCGMVLKNSYVINSKYLMSPKLQPLIDTCEFRNVNNEIFKKLKVRKAPKTPSNTGKHCSDFSYETDEISVDLQMSNSSQYHLSNLMFLTLCDRCVRDKNYIPLWNFIITNKKYNTSLSSIILSQSGLYSSAILFAMTRGACLDVFCCLIGAIEHVLDVTNEINTYMYNLSESIFMECITYLQNYSIDYFQIIRKNLHKFDVNVIERLSQQLNPFDPIYRPIMAKLSNQNTLDKKDMDKNFLIFCKSFIETFLVIQIKKQTMMKYYLDNYSNALNFFRVYHEDKQFASKLENFSPISAGFSHAGCVMNSVAYIWGNNGVNCALNRSALQADQVEASSGPTSVDFLRDLNLDVYAVKCGRQHTLIVTNNGIYALGSNQFGQLGVGKNLSQALQPMLISNIDSKTIRILSVGSYHNAVVANDILYTWGWNVYGQLGNGTILDVHQPRAVPFFRDKYIRQVSLGHVHTVVLCNDNDLYVFGSNHYGQLGVGHDYSPVLDGAIPRPSNTKRSFLKSLVPIKLDFNEKVSIICTKYFCNLVVTETNNLYIWGSSPQVLRLAIQAKKRAKATQKMEESIKNELNRRAENEVATETARADSDFKQSKVDDEAMIAVAKKTEIPKLETLARNNVNLGENSNKMEIPTVKIDTVPEVPVEEAHENNDSADKMEEDDEVKIPVIEEIVEENKDHLLPLLIDTSSVDGNIVQVATGLYHFALITSDNKLFTWGKNLERQLGRLGPRSDSPLPTEVDILSNSLHVECGADFTIVIDRDYTIKAFGNTNNGQCGKEIQMDKSGIPSKMMRLRMTKRLVRIPEGSQCIETPIDVVLPVNYSHQQKNYSTNEPIKFLKKIPKFNESFIVKHDLVLLESYQASNKHNIAQPPNHTKHYHNSHTAECPNQILNSNINNNNNTTNIDDQLIKNTIEEADSMFSLPLTPVTSEITNTTTESKLQEYRRHNDFIHYCLYIFHGLYDQNFINSLSSAEELVQHKFNEYQLRLLMLNYNYLEAFKLIMKIEQEEFARLENVTIEEQLHTDRLSQNLIKIFEYFTYDNINIVPMHQDDIKYFIHDLFYHFIENNLNRSLLEEFFIKHLDYYLLQLGYLFYFHNGHATNNNHTNNNANVNTATFNSNNNLIQNDAAPTDKMFDQELREKFSRLYCDEDNDLLRLSNLVHVNRIFNDLSIKFNLIICESLMKYVSRYDD